jgi:hypothetical protein
LARRSILAAKHRIELIVHLLEDTRHFSRQPFVRSGRGCFSIRGEERVAAFLAEFCSLSIRRPTRPAFEFFHQETPKKEFIAFPEI